MLDNNQTEELTFSNLGLAPNLLAVLERNNFTVPTPIQHKAIPIAIQGKDVMGIAQTGTGKTLAFSLPMLQQIAQTKKRGLVILPTRELAIQVDKTLQNLGKDFGLRRALLIGGASMNLQLNEIRRNPHVVIGTPGRIIDHIERGSLNLRGIGVLVLDEADHMLDMGFAPQIKRILQGVPKERQTMLFSATMPPEIVRIASSYMKIPVRVEIAPPGTVIELIEHELFVVQKDQKNRLLDKILDDYIGTILIFSRTKHGAKKICRAIRAMSHTAAEIHSNLSLAQRRKSLDGFKTGEYRILVATDIAARGIDVTNIELVINYDLPDNLDDYVHRVGRTGRAGKVGKAISFVTPDQRGKIRGIEKLVKSTLNISPLPQLPKARPVPFAPAQHGDFRRQNNFSPKKSKPSFSRGGHTNRRNFHRSR